MNGIFAGLYPDLDDALIKGVGGIGVKCIKGKVHEQKDQEGETPTSASRSGTTIFHDR